ncbi:hypothetical protein NPIL_472561 [Nephila pilipes]|uniref:Uncharacterized protein n=1 Tax=Nephila pilipes TaxID=299642 RepID=A0A8X6Q2W9_NEPPI|nr:hypothetical protein NPIL_472561 [Nephila pilipes]
MKLLNNNLTSSVASYNDHSLRSLDLPFGLTIHMFILSIYQEMFFHFARCGRAYEELCGDDLSIEEAVRVEIVEWTPLSIGFLMVVI